MRKAGVGLLTLCSLFSSSAGNVIYCGTENNGLIVDAGVSGKLVLEALKNKEINPGCIRAILVTHDHMDHIKSVGILSRKLGIPVYATEGTWQGMSNCIGTISPENRIVVREGESFFITDMEIMPFAIPHDTAEPVGYRVFAHDGSISVATDLGCFSKTVMNAVEGSDVVLLESNHDVELLNQNPRYPAQLKKRILGRKGHLSNPDSGNAALTLLKSGTRHFLLGHLSPENNTPQLAYQTVRQVLTDAGAEENGDFSLHIAPQSVPGCKYTLGR